MQAIEVDGLDKTGRTMSVAHKGDGDDDGDRPGRNLQCNQLQGFALAYGCLKPMKSSVFHQKRSVQHAHASVTLVALRAHVEAQLSTRFCAAVFVSEANRQFHESVLFFSARGLRHVIATLHRHQRPFGYRHKDNPGQERGATGMAM